MLNSIRIVLVSTSHPGNIGSAARAMKTMGLKSLYLVNPKSFPDIKANELAAGADDILNQCKVVHSLQEAISDCSQVIATSARPRGLSLPGFTPAECAQFVVSHPSDKIALVFGREHAGLTNEELLQCHYHVNIPANPEYSSLNLAQAVQVMAYEMRVKSLNAEAQVASREAEYASVADVERFYEHFWQVLKEVKFFKEHSGRVQERLRRLFNRSRLETMEVNILRGILTHIQQSLPTNESPPHETEK